MFYKTRFDQGGCGGEELGGLGGVAQPWSWCGLWCLSNASQPLLHSMDRAVGDAALKLSWASILPEIPNSKSQTATQTPKTKTHQSASGGEELGGLGGVATPSRGR